MSYRYWVNFQTGRYFEEEQAEQLNADTVHAKSCSASSAERFGLIEGNYYELEIVRPNNSDSIAKWGLDGTRYINGQSRVVSRLVLFVRSVDRNGDILFLTCRGQDNQGRNADGVYPYYISPDSRGHRGTYILSARRR